MDIKLLPSSHIHNLVSMIGDRKFCAVLIIGFSKNSAIVSVCTSISRIKLYWHTRQFLQDFLRNLWNLESQQATIRLL